MILHNVIHTNFEDLCGPQIIYLWNPTLPCPSPSLGARRVPGGGVVRETVRVHWMQNALLWFYRHECRQVSRGMQTCRGIEKNIQTIKLTNHEHVSAPSFVLKLLP